jgi:signal transduction histidine kinase
MGEPEPPGESPTVREEIRAARPPGCVESEPGLSSKIQPLAAVQQIARTLVEELNPDRVAAVIADQSFCLCHAAAVGVWFVDVTRGELRLLGRQGIREPSPEAWRTLAAMPLNAPSFPSVAAQTGQPIEIADIATVGPGFELSCQLMREEGLHSVLAKPLFARGRTVGVLTILYATPHTFVPEERELVEAMGDLWSIAIDNACLYQEAQQAIAHERTVRTEVESTNARLRVTNLSLAESRQRAQRLAADLKGERDRLQQVVDALPVGLAIVDATGRYVLVNAIAREVNGHDPVGQSIFATGALPLNARHADGTPYREQETPLHRSLHDGEIVRGDQMSLPADGTGRELPLLVDSVPLRDGRGRISGAVVVFQDISQLRELQRMRDEWVSLIAHDLRQPVTVISGYVELLERRIAGRSDLARERQLLAHVGTAARNLDHMVGDLLDVSRIETRRLTIEPRPIDLATFAQDVVERSATMTPGHAIRLQVHDDIPPVHADPARVEQILGNLLANAAKYGYASSSIWVDLIRRGEMVQVSVTNLGDGIPRQEVPKLFSRFHRAPKIIEKRAGGLGLGLYIAKGLVEAHGGRIWVESVPKKATTFHFTLPIPRPPD